MRGQKKIISEVLALKLLKILIKIICTEIPDPELDPKLYYKVVTPSRMIDDSPCGRNSDESCPLYHSRNDGK